MKAKEKVYGCSKVGHAGGWCDVGRCRAQGKMETYYPLWLTLMGAAERRRKRYIV